LHVFSQTNIQCLVKKMHFPSFVFHQVGQKHYSGEVANIPAFDFPIP